MWEIAAHNCVTSNTNGQKGPGSGENEKARWRWMECTLGSGGGAAQLHSGYGWREGRACHGGPASASNWLEDLYSLGLSFSSTKW